MLIIDEKETMLWLSKHGLLNAVGKLSLPRDIEPLSFKIPVDTGAKTALSRMLVSFLDVSEEALLWITEWGIWPSCEDWKLFYVFRKSLGEHRPLIEKPSHLFSSQDLDSVTSLVSMVLYFSWGALMISPANNLIIRISHDEIMDVFAKERDHLTAIELSLTKICGDRLQRCPGKKSKKKFMK